MKCENCGTSVFKGPDGEIYHARNVSRACYPGSSSDAVATAPAKQ